MEGELSVLDARRQHEVTSPAARRILAGQALESESDALARLSQGSADVVEDLDSAQARVTELGVEASRFNAEQEAEHARAAERALGTARTYLAQGDLFNARIWVQTSMISASHALSLASRGGAPNGVGVQSPGD